MCGRVGRCGEGTEVEAVCTQLGTAVCFLCTVRVMQDMHSSFPTSHPSLHSHRVVCGEGHEGRWRGLVLGGVGVPQEGPGEGDEHETRDDEVGRLAVVSFHHGDQWEPTLGGDSERQALAALGEWGERGVCGGVGERGSGESGEGVL